MCRFLAYKGAPITLDKLLYQPKNSLIHQSYKAQERPEPLNGDGFGVGWYVRELNPEPAVFVSTTPAWNNRNLRYNAPKIRSNCVFNWIQGQTDSEHFFALFLNNLLKKETARSARDAVVALEATITELREITSQRGVNEPTYLNVALTEGTWMVASCYVTDPALTPPTLYHSEGSRFDCEEGVCHMFQADQTDHAVLIVSEKLTDMQEDWHKVPPNHVVIVSHDLAVSVLPIKV